MPKNAFLTEEYIEQWANTNSGPKLVKYFRYKRPGVAFDYYCKIPTKENAGAPWGLHKAVWEDWHGLKVPKGYVIHHINEDSTDNRPENFKCMKILDHNAHHRLVRAKLTDFLMYRNQMNLFN